MRTVTLKMTIKEVLTLVHDNCPDVSIRYSSDCKEFRITTRFGTVQEREDRAYYTDDKLDALQTAQYMQKYTVDKYNMQSLAIARNLGIEGAV